MPNVIATHLHHLMDHGQCDFLQQALAYLEEESCSKNKNSSPVEMTKEEFIYNNLPGIDLTIINHSNYPESSPVNTHLQTRPVAAIFS